jgi:hypothetical protein
MKYLGFELLAEETSHIADDLIEIHAATEAAVSEREPAAY